MKLAQRSVVHFGSRFASSIVGFLSVLYFSRVLGSGVLGQYFLALAVVSWAVLPGLSVSFAVTKRLSERASDAGRLLSAGLAIQAALSVLIVAGLFALGGAVNDYVGEPAVALVAAMVLAKFLYEFVGAVLDGQGKVHVHGLLDPVNVVLQRGLQLAAVVLSFGLAGLLAGYVVGMVCASVVGLRYAVVRFGRPERRHFRRLYDYVKHSWVSNVEGRTLSTMDTFVLGFFVADGLVGIYGVAWNIASLLALFGFSVSAVLFPEISRESSEGSTERIAGLVTDSLAFSGLFLIPGLVGGAFVGNRVLALYGPDFARGVAVLTVLIAGRLVHMYHHQLTNALNAIDRADLTLRVNLAFIVSNVCLNVALVSVYGWTGAAVATLLSAAVAFVLGFRYSRALIDYAVPVAELGRQVVAAALMGLAIVGVGVASDADALFGYRFVYTVALVALGAGIYFVVLVGISPALRAKIAENVSVAPWTT